MGPASVSDSELKRGQGDLVFIFDWDDTLCASTFGQRQGHTSVLMPTVSSPIFGFFEQEPKLPPDARNQWRQLGLWAKAVLHLALRFAPDGVYLVTNSQKGWVELTIKHLMPELKPLLPYLKIISARSSFSTPEQERAMKEKRLGEEDLVEWKYRAVMTLLNQRPNPPLTRVIAMGDSHIELKALDRAATVLKLANTKWIKFTHEPSLQALVDQLYYVWRILPQVIWYQPSLRITLNPHVFSNIPKQNPFLPRLPTN